MEIVKRVCVLTGASGLFGHAFIRRYAKKFRIVAVHNRHEIDYPTQDQTFIDPLAPAKAVPRNPTSVFAVRADLAYPSNIDSLTDTILGKFKRVDLLINATMYYRPSALLAGNSLNDGEAHFSVNVLAPMRLAVSLAEKFWAASVKENIALNRNIVNLSSTSGFYVYPDIGQALYSATKSALNFATYHMASEFWDIGVRVNAVAPTRFPEIVSIERVLDETLALDNSHDTGRIVIVDQ